MAAKYECLEPESGHKENPKKNANIFSLLSLSWVEHILAIGNKRPLENDDLFPLLDEDKTQTSTETLQLTWKEETAKRVPGKRGNGYRLLRALLRMFPWTDYMLLLFAVLIDVAATSFQPVFLSLMLMELINTSAEESWWAYFYAAGIWMSALVRVTSEYFFVYNSEVLALRWKSATIGIVYQKVGGGTTAIFLPFDAIFVLVFVRRPHLFRETCVMVSFLRSRTIQTSLTVQKLRLRLSVVYKWLCRDKVHSLSNYRCKFECDNSISFRRQKLI